MSNHACERAEERMGVVLEVADLRGMALKIANGAAIRLGSKKRDAEHWLVTWKGKAFRVIYKMGMIVTVLQPMRANPKRRRWKAKHQ